MRAFIFQVVIIIEMNLKFRNAPAVFVSCAFERNGAGNFVFVSCAICHLNVLIHGNDDFNSTASFI